MKSKRGDPHVITWGQVVLVENRAGANGSIGMDYAARQPAYGSSFVIGNMGPVTINPQISKVPYAPKAAAERLQSSLVKVMMSADIREKFEGMSVEALSSTPEGLREFTLAETEKWGNLVREAGIRAD